MIYFCPRFWAFSVDLARAREYALVRRSSLLALALPLQRGTGCARAVEIRHPYSPPQINESGTPGRAPLSSLSGIRGNPDPTNCVMGTMPRCRAQRNCFPLENCRKAEARHEPSRKAFAGNDAGPRPDRLPPRVRGPAERCRGRAPPPDAGRPPVVPPWVHGTLHRAHDRPAPGAEADEPSAPLALAAPFLSPIRLATGSTTSPAWVGVDPVRPHPTFIRYRLRVRQTVEPCP